MSDFLTYSHFSLTFECFPSSMIKSKFGLQNYRNIKLSSHDFCSLRANAGEKKALLLKKIQQLDADCQAQENHWKQKYLEEESKLKAKLETWNGKVHDTCCEVSVMFDEANLLFGRFCKLKPSSQCSESKTLSVWLLYFDNLFPFHVVVAFPMNTISRAVRLRKLVLYERCISVIIPSTVLLKLGATESACCASSNSIHPLLTANFGASIC